MNFLGLNKNKTFKPRKNIPEGTRQYTLYRYVERTLDSGDLKKAVILPPGEDLDEWLAVNTVDFYNQVNLIYGTVTEQCNPTTCPVMNAGPKYEYHWCDGIQFSKPIQVSAPQYVDYLMTWIQSQFDDEGVFPTRIGVPFPKSFQSTIKTIFKRLFRVYAHIYLTHFSYLVELGQEAHMNTSFRHFYYFSKEFNLLDKKELAPLIDLIKRID
jgi:MOB kinase activator 1